MSILNALIEFLNTEAGLLLVGAVVTWLGQRVLVELPTANREQVDRAARIAVWAVEQLRKSQTLTAEESKARALEAARNALPIAVRMMVKDESLSHAIEAVIGEANAKAAKP